MLELHVADTKVNRGAVQVTWCVDRETLKSLEGMPGEAYLLLIAGPTPTESSYGFSQHVRKLVPLSDGIAFIGFRKPGPHYVWGQLFVGDRRKLASLMSRFEGVYDTDLISEATMMPYMTENLGRQGLIEDQTARIEIVVPEACFAKKPPAWLDRWVHWTLGSRGDDQCGFRRRLLFAFTVQPILFALYMLARVVVGLLGLSFGVQGIRYKRLFLHPFGTDFGPAMGNTDESVFYRLELPKSLRVLPLAFMPGTTVLLGLLLFAISRGKDSPFHRLSFGRACLFGFELILGIAVIVTVVLGIVEFFKRLEKRAKTESNREPKGEVRFKEETVQALACGDRAANPLGAPTLGRRIVLTYESVKADICRPFSS